MEVLLVDDHPLLNAGIVSILEGTGLFSVCGQAENLTEAMEIIKTSENMPSLIILDLLLGDESGLDLFPLLKEYCETKKIPLPKVLVCSALEDTFKIQTTLKLGAVGFLSKTGGREELLKAISTILEGKSYVSGELHLKLKESSKLYAKFTKKEINVIDLVKQNKTNQQIAQSLCISIRTVENYISNIYFKTGFANREEIKKI